jgi:hypothetical protein
VGERGVKKSCFKVSFEFGYYFSEMKYSEMPKILLKLTPVQYMFK